MQAEPVGGRLLAAAGHLEDQLEQLPADLGDTRLAGGDAAGVEIDEVVPALG